MKNWLKKQLKAKEEARAALKEKGMKSENVEEVRSIGEQIEVLDAEIAEFRTQLEALPDDGQIDQNEEGGGEQRSTPEGQLNVLGTYGLGNSHSQKEEKREADEIEKKFEVRGADLKIKKAVTFDLDELPELRAVTIGGGKLINQKKYSNTLNPNFNEVSATIDLVNAVPLIGGESYEKGFVKSWGEAGYNSETGEYKEADPEFDYVTIGKAKITAYTEMSDEAMKLPNVNYQALVAKNISIALRKKISKQIIVGAGDANTITGIFNAPAKVIPPSSDIEISQIDENTLDDIVFGYGGDEDVEGNGYLMLNKKDLAAFANVRDGLAQKIYKIKLNGNTGTISSSESYEIPFVINSACKPFNEAGDGEFVMAYGMVHCYEMPVFSPITVEESHDYKFRTGQVAYRGSVWAGGNVAMYKGFVRVKKKVTT